MRGYLAKAESQLREAKKLRPAESAEVEEVVGQFKARLREEKFHGGYFSRSEDDKVRICDKTGEEGFKIDERS